MDGRYLQYKLNCSINIKTEFIDLMNDEDYQEKARQFFLLMFKTENM